MFGVEPLLSAHLLNDHPYSAASNQSLDEDNIIIPPGCTNPAGRLRN